MMQNPLFPSAAQGDDPAADNSPLPDYLQTGAVQAAPQPQPLPASSVTLPQADTLQPAQIVRPEPFGKPQYGAVVIPQQPADATGFASADDFPPKVDLNLDRDKKPAASPDRADDPNRNSAADLIRQKLNAIYAAEPDAQAEIQHIEAEGPAAQFSKHQQYMQMLTESGKPWAEIQNDWHAYYIELPDEEKHQVWDEFYASGNQQTIMPGPQPGGQPLMNQPAAQPLMPAVQIPTPTHVEAVPAQPWHATATQPVVSLGSPTVADAAPIPAAGGQPVVGTTPGSRFLPDSRMSNLPSAADIKQKVLSKVSGAGQSKVKQHFQSLAFGVMTGTAAVLFFLLLFFNEVVIAPFIQPSRTATETPIIVDTASTVVSNEPKVIIPKINVEIPVVYNVPSTEESVIQKALNNGVVHYPTTVRPGQEGNAAFFGHSSNNILNPGKYKFAFLLLNKLRTGDTFYLTYEGKPYAYEVISTRVVEPTEVGVLGPVPNEKSTATLITCDPPGTSLKRLVVVGRQTSPDPSGNPAPSTPPGTQIQTAAATQMPGNGPTLWSRMWNSIF